MDATTQVDSHAASGSRENALKHGLTAKTLLPKILLPGRLPLIVAALREEYRPVTMTEEILLREIARHAAQLELGEEAEGAVLRQGAIALSAVATAQEQAPDDLLLAAAVSSEPLDKFARYRRGHEKALHQAIAKLREIIAARLEGLGDTEATTTVDPFDTEESCAAHLRARFARPNWCCPDCKNPTGHIITTRDQWECANCKKQIGLRTGTVLERSPLPLVTWFRAIRAVIADPNIGAPSLAERASIRRPATAQSVLARITAALTAADATQRLASLEQFPQGPASALSQAIEEEHKLRNEI